MLLFLKKNARFYNRRLTSAGRKENHNKTEKRKMGFFITTSSCRTVVKVEPDAAEGRGQVLEHDTGQNSYSRLHTYTRQQGETEDQGER